MRVLPRSFAGGAGRLAGEIVDRIDEFAFGEVGIGEFRSRMVAELAHFVMTHRRFAEERVVPVRTIQPFVMRICAGFLTETGAWILRPGRGCRRQVCCRSVAGRH